MAEQARVTIDGWLGMVAHKRVAINKAGLGLSLTADIEKVKSGWIPDGRWTGLAAGEGSLQGRTYALMLSVATSSRSRA